MRAGGRSVTTNLNSAMGVPEHRYSSGDGALSSRRETDGHCYCSSGGDWTTTTTRTTGGVPGMRKPTTSTMPGTDRPASGGATCANGAAVPARWQTSGSPTAGAGLNAASVTRPMATVPSWHVPIGEMR